LIDEVQLKSAPLHTGINESAKVSRNVSVYPNPVQNNVLFAFTNPDVSQNQLTLKIFNNLGEVIYEHNYAGNTRMINLDMTTYKTGIYFYNILNGTSLIY